MRTKLVNNDEEYLSIVKDILLEVGSHKKKPGSQEVLDVLLTQASMEMKIKKYYFCIVIYYYCLVRARILHFNYYL